ncbi:MAG: Holliday junction branch migration protein RuvA [Clostridia bacterium]|nr:Holliday junction branch migration protein RuvA [Clostridia bacterium]
MYYYVKGELTYSDQSTAVVECGGVGYKLTISLITSDVLSRKRGETVRLFTHLSVREDGVELFGFLSEEEREVFNLLTGVSGVGPKAAMSLLSSFSPDKLIFAVGTEDVKSLARANGIGGKTAARIVLELKDKVSVDLFRESGATAAKPDGTTAEQTRKNGKLTEATEALTALGYDRSQILSALRGLDTEKLTLEEIITAALRKFVK